MKFPIEDLRKAVASAAALATTFRHYRRMRERAEELLWTVRELLESDTRFMNNDNLRIFDDEFNDTTLHNHGFRWVSPHEIQIVEFVDENKTQWKPL